MKCLIVISVDLPTPDDVGKVLTHMDPPNIPFFDKDVRVVVEPDVKDVIVFLDDGDSPIPKEREEIIAKAKVIHDQSCGCDPKYIMSCSWMAKAILSLGKT